MNLFQDTCESSGFNLVCFQLCVFHLKDYGNCKDGLRCHGKSLQTIIPLKKVILPRFASPKNSLGFAPMSLQAPLTRMTWTDMPFPAARPSGDGQMHRGGRRWKREAWRWNDFAVDADHLKLGGLESF